MDILERLSRIKNKVWIAVGVVLGVSIVFIVVVVLTALLLKARDARKAPRIVKNPIGIEFISVPPGSFLMGSDNGRDDEKPAHQVIISKGFLIGRYEVTQGQWKTVMGREPVSFKGNDFPLQFVTWDETQEFIARLNELKDGYAYRLPIEAEWEYACRAGTTTNYADDLEWLAWYAGNSGQRVHKVGYLHPNAWGVYDMHGNVSEYCQDWYDENYYSRSPSADPQGPSSGKQRVSRGGSFFDIGPFSASADSSNLRSAARQPVFPNEGPLDDRGFRVVAVAKK